MLETYKKQKQQFYISESSIIFNNLTGNDCDDNVQ